MDDRDVDVRPGGEQGIRSLPWITHGVAAVGLFSWMLWSQISEYGLTSESRYSILFMDPVILVFAWALTLPLGLVEAAGWTRLGRWVSRAAAFTATGVLIWFGSLPVGLRFFADQAPVTHAEVRSAGANCLVLIAGYLLAVIALRVCFQQLRRRRTS